MTRRSRVQILPPLRRNPVVDDAAAAVVGADQYGAPNAGGREVRGLSFAAALFAIVVVGCGDTVGTTITTMGSGIQDTATTSVLITTVAPNTTIAPTTVAPTTTVVQQTEELILFPLDTLDFNAQLKGDVRAGGVVADGILYLILGLPEPLNLETSCLLVALGSSTDTPDDLYLAQVGDACFEEGVDPLQIRLTGRRGSSGVVILDTGPTPNQDFGLFFELSVEDASGSLDLSASRFGTTPEGVDVSSQLVDASCCGELRIKLWDTEEAIYDSVLLLDNFQWSVDSSDPGSIIID